MFKVIAGGAGSGKSTYLINMIKSETENGKNPLVIIPDQFSFEYDRKLYLTLGAELYNMVSTISFSRLAEDIFIKFGGRSGSYADEITKTALMFNTVNKFRKNNSLQFFDRQVKTQGFVSMALDTVSDLKKTGLSPEMFREKTKDLDGTVKQKIDDLIEIYADYDESLKANGYKDNLDDISEAGFIAQQNDFFRGKTVFIEEFNTFPADEYHMLEIIMSQADDVIISMKTENPYDNEFSVFESVNKTFRRLKYISQECGQEFSLKLLDSSYSHSVPDIAYLSRNIMRNREKLFPVSDHIRIIEAKDMYEEVEWVSAQIKRLTMDFGYKYNEIAVLSRRLEDYASVIEASFERFSIPYFLDMKKSVMHTSVMLLFTGALELISKKTPDTETVLRYAKTQLLGIPYEKISLLENFCYKWGVKGEMWLEPFSVKRNNEAENETSETFEAEELRKKIMTPIINLRARSLDSTGKEICKAVWNYLEEAEISRNISGISEDFRENGNETASREMRQLWDSLIDMLDALSEALSDTPVSIRDFRELVLTILKNNTYAMPPQTLDAVILSSSERAKLNTPKVTFILGANEGYFPFSSVSTGFFTDNDKMLISRMGIDLSKDSTAILFDERFTVYTTVSSPKELLYISYALSDTSGSVMFPSYLIPQIKKMFSNNIFIRAAKASETFWSSTKRSAYYNYVRNFNSDTPEHSAIREALKDDPYYSSKLEYLHSVQHNPKFRIYDTGIIRRMFSTHLRISATKVESYSKCPFGFFCENGLKIRPRTKYELNHLSNGNIVHYCMEKLIGNYSDNPKEFISRSKQDLKAEINGYLDTYKAEELGGDFGKTKRFEKAYERISDDITELAMHIQNEFSQSGFVPAEFELEIDEKSGAGKPMRLKTKDGIEVIITGKIDRVDTYSHDGQTFVRIIDYKTGKQEFSLTNLIYGINMQMLIYLFSITDKFGKYDFAKPAGVLYMPASALQCENEGNKTVEETKNKHYRMKGLVLEDRDVITAMESNALGIYIPITFNKPDKNGISKLSSRSEGSVLNACQFEKLNKLIKKTVTDIAERLYNGDISANPLNPEDTCRYCVYNEVCGNVPARQSRKTVKQDIKEFKKMLDEQED